MEAKKVNKENWMDGFNFDDESWEPQTKSQHQFINSGHIHLPSLLTQPPLAYMSQSSIYGGGRGGRVRKKKPWTSIMPVYPPDPEAEAHRMISMSVV